MINQRHMATERLTNDVELIWQLHFHGLETDRSWLVSDEYVLGRLLINDYFVLQKWEANGFQHQRKTTQWNHLSSVKHMCISWCLNPKTFMYGTLTDMLQMTCLSLEHSEKMLMLIWYDSTHRGPTILVPQGKLGKIQSHLSYPIGSSRIHTWYMWTNIKGWYQW